MRQEELRLDLRRDAVGAILSLTKGRLMSDPAPAAVLRRSVAATELAPPVVTCDSCEGRGTVVAQAGLEGILLLHGSNSRSSHATERVESDGLEASIPTGATPSHWHVMIIQQVGAPRKYLDSCVYVILRFLIQSFQTT